MLFRKGHNLAQNNLNFASWGCFGILRTSSCWWALRFLKLMHPGLRNWWKREGLKDSVANCISLFVTFKFFIWSVCSISESATQNYRYCWYQSAIAGKQSKINVFLSLELVKCDYNLSWIAEYHKTLQQHSAEIESFISVNST